MKRFIADGTISLRAARQWCSDAHGAQPYGGKPYGQSHLPEVEAVAVEFGFARNRTIRISCWAHDVPEDTNKTREDMRAACFSASVIAISWALKDQPGANRTESKLATYPYIREIWEAIVVKLCDRIANCRHSRWDDRSKFRRYVREYPSFREHLFDPQEKDQRVLAMWRHLDELMGVNA